MAPETQPPVLLKRLDEHLTNPQRQALVGWASELLRIRETAAPPLRKAKAALDATYRAEVVLPVLRSVGRELVELAWTDRGWAARLGLGAAALTVLTAGGQGAGIAALGGAVGVPLWIVLGSGGAFAGMLVDELQGSIRRHQAAHGHRPVISGEIEDAEWELLPDAGGSLPVVAEPARPGETAPEPLWRHFRRAYREARTRQRRDGP